MCPCYKSSKDIHSVDGSSYEDRFHARSNEIPNVYPPISKLALNTSRSSCAIEAAVPLLYDTSECAKPTLPACCGHWYLSSNCRPGPCQFITSSWACVELVTVISAMDTTSHPNSTNTLTEINDLIRRQATNMSSKHIFQKPPRGSAIVKSLH